jgi:hypothetical protein
MTLELARPNVWPFWSAVDIAGSDLQMPGSVITNQKAGDVLEAEGFHGRMVLEGADLKSGQ